MAMSQIAFNKIRIAFPVGMHTHAMSVQKYGCGALKRHEYWVFVAVKFSKQRQGSKRILYSLCNEGRALHRKV